MSCLGTVSLSGFAAVSVNNPDSETGRICQEHARSNLKNVICEKKMYVW
jgi:hypothetical protein